MKKAHSFFKWAGIILFVGLLLLPLRNQNVRAGGESALSNNSLPSASTQDPYLTLDDLPGFRQARESEVVGTLAFAERLSKGLFGPQTVITNLSTFQIINIFRPEYVISFLAYPLSEQEAVSFDALAADPDSVLAALAEAAKTSGNSVEPRLNPDLGDVGERSVGFSMELGLEPVAQAVDFLWTRRGTILQATWVIYPIGETPTADLHQLGLLVDKRVNERFPGATFRQAGEFVPDITTQIPTPLDISTRPGVIGTNLLLAALMMLPFTLAAEVFTSLSAEREVVLREKFWLTRWLFKLPARLKKRAAARQKQPGTGGTILRLLVIVFFYGLAFSLLDRSWNPLSVTGIVLFLNMTVAYGVVGIADDIIQWRVLKKWGEPAEINLRPTNILIAATSAITSRLLALAPGLMFGTPEALIIDEARLEEKKHNHLLKISAFTLLGIGLGLWALTTLTTFVQRQNISETMRNVTGGAEGFLLIVFAVALENTFVRMLGLPGTFGEAIRKKNRGFWLLGLTAITFAFYHTLINPRGELSEALQESNVQIFLAVTGAFVILTFSLWAYLSIKAEKPADTQPTEEEKSRKKKARAIIPTWTWLAVIIIVATVTGDILITRHNQQALLASSSATLEAGESAQAGAPTPTAGEPGEVKPAFGVTGAFGKICYLPGVSVSGNPEDTYTWRAAQLVAAQYGTGSEYVDPGTPDDAGYSTAIAQLVRDKCDLIVGNYSPQGLAIMNLAAGYPDQNFMLIGGGSELPNVWVTKYSLPGQAYLAGYLAAAASTSGKVGTFGYQQIPDMVSSMNCFAEGVNEYDRRKQAGVTVLGWDSTKQLGLVADDLKNPDQGINFTNDLISQGADVIFPMANSGLSSNATGIMMVARQHAGVYVIGVDLDWAWALPEYSAGIISSAQTRSDHSVALAADAVAKGEFHGGVHMGNQMTGEIGFAPLRAFPGVVSGELKHDMAKMADIGAIDSADTNMNINGFPDLDSVDGANWPANTWVTIRIESPEGETLFTGDARTDQVGHFFQPVGVDLVPGMVVVVDGCLSSRSTTIVPMTIDDIDLENDIVSGSAPSGTRIWIMVDVNGVWNDVMETKAADGHWQASYAGKSDLTTPYVIQAVAMDEQGNGTAIKIGSTDNFKPVPLPSQPPKPTSTTAPTATLDQKATVTPTPTASPTVVQTVGEKITLPFSTGVTHIQFKAGAPFYIQHGWAEAVDPLTLGLGFELEVDGIPRDEDAIIRTVGAEGQIIQMWTYNYPLGMSGTHLFKGTFLSTCQYALDNGRASSCVNPAEIGVFGTRSLTVDFIP